MCGGMLIKIEIERLGDWGIQDNESPNLRRQCPKDWQICPCLSASHFQGVIKMLKGISPLFSPELLATLYRMGHGDEIVLADAHFPGESLGVPVVRADGLLVAPLLDAILPLLELDSYVEAPVLMMAVVPGDTADPTVEADYRRVIDRHQPATPPIQRLDRFAFYDRCRQAFAVVMTGDTRKYANVILKKGVTPTS